MSKPIADMMEGVAQAADKQAVTKFQLEENIRTSRKWADALGRVQCSGKDALLIAGLLGFLEDQHTKSLAEYEAAMAKNASWGRPKDLELAAAGRPS
jgi:hypothetical protein